jgi:hypothetical protein
VTAVLAGWRTITGAVGGGWNDGTGWMVYVAVPVASPDDVAVTVTVPAVN